MKTRLDDVHSEVQCHVSWLVGTSVIISHGKNFLIAHKVWRNFEDKLSTIKKCKLMRTIPKNSVNVRLCILCDMEGVMLQRNNFVACFSLGAKIVVSLTFLDGCMYLGAFQVVVFGSGI